MIVIPLTLKQSNHVITCWHRHHKTVQGCKFCIGAMENEKLVGVAVVGRPVARGCDTYLTAEVTRLATNGFPNACSFLYAACARISREMGFNKIQTYILETEPGTSLIASGWVKEDITRGGDWNNSKQYAGTRRTDQPMCRKIRYAKYLR